MDVNTKNKFKNKLFTLNEIGNKYWSKDSITMDIDLYRDLILSRSIHKDRCDRYFTNEIELALKQSLRFNFNKNVSVKFKMLTAKICFLFDKKSLLHKSILDVYKQKNNVLPLTKDSWDYLYLNDRLGKHRLPSHMTRDEAEIYIQVILWAYDYKINGGKLIKINLLNDYKDFIIYWSESPPTEITLQNNFSFNKSPWADLPNLTCDYQEFCNILKATFNGKMPSETWLYNLFTHGNAKNVLRKRTFTHIDYINVIEAVTTSKKLSKKLIRSLSSTQLIENYIAIKAIEIKD